MVDMELKFSEAAYKLFFTQRTTHILANISITLSVACQNYLELVIDGCLFLSLSLSLSLSLFFYEELIYYIFTNSDFMQICKVVESRLGPACGLVISRF